MARAMTSIKPKPGLVVRDPATGQPLPDTATPVVWSSYWRRREREGSIEVIQKPPRQAPARKPSRRDTSNQE
mgnify:CR=1 FL=1